MARTDIKLLLAACALCGLSACDKYVDRRDQVTFGSGDAVAFNRAAQIIDPWPQDARHVTNGMRGEQAEAALAKLRKREAGESTELVAPPIANLRTEPQTGAARQ
jgi:hypothetical protein